MFGTESQEERSSTKEEQRDIAVPLPIDTPHGGASNVVQPEPLPIRLQPEQRLAVALALSHFFAHYRCPALTLLSGALSVP